jgi:hypothetical protein
METEVGSIDSMKSFQAFVSSLMTGSLLPDCPPMESVRVLRIKKHETVILILGEINTELVPRLKREWAKRFPDIECIVEVPRGVYK